MSSSHRHREADRQVGLEQGSRAECIQAARGAAAQGHLTFNSETKTCWMCTKGGCVWCQATFLKVSFWQKVFGRCLKMFSLLRLAGPCKLSSLPKEDTESHRPHQGAPNVAFHSNLFLPNQQSPWLYGQRHVSTPSTGSHTTDLHKLSHSVPQKLNEFGPTLHLENCP